MSGYRTGNADAEATRLKERFRSIFRRRERRSRVWPLVRRSLIGSGIGLGIVGAHLALSPWPLLTTVRHLAASPNCATARLLDLAPARRGQPGYWPQHDADDDGIACEPVPRWKRGYGRW